jgi:hypothetical protein
MRSPVVDRSDAVFELEVLTERVVLLGEREHEQDIHPRAHRAHLQRSWRRTGPASRLVHGGRARWLRCNGLRRSRRPVLRCTTPPEIAGDRGLPTGRYDEHEHHQGERQQFHPQRLHRVVIQQTVAQATDRLMAELEDQSRLVR